MTVTNELKQENMKPVMNINNIFVSAFIGVVLFIAALAFISTHFVQIAALELSPVVIAGTLGASSLVLITLAVKADKHRLKQQANTTA